MRLWAKCIPFFCLILFAAILGGQMLRFRQAETQVSHGIASYNQGAYGKAESEMRSALTLNPDNAYASYYLGLCLLKKGDSTEARQRFKTAQAIAQGGKLMTRNEPLAEEATTALSQMKQP